MVRACFQKKERRNIAAGQACRAVKRGREMHSGILRPVSLNELALQP